MTATTVPNARKGGFALIVVLFALAILALLFATAQRNTMAALGFAEAERAVITRLHNRAVALDALITSGRPEGDVLRWEIGSEQSLFRLQSTGGLVDLNAASPVLMELFLRGFDLSDLAVSDALSAYRSWRREGRRLNRVADFERIVELELPGLKALATVHSGRTGISEDQAPLPLLEHLAGRVGDRAGLIEGLPPAIFGPATTVSFAVLDEDGTRIGVVRFGPRAGSHAIIAFDGL